MKREEIEELKGLATSMGLYDDKNPCKRAVILGKAIKALEQEPIIKNDCIDKAEFIKKLESETIGLQSWQKALIYQVMDDCNSITLQESQSEYIHDHEILKAYSDGVNEVLDKIRAEMKQYQSDYDVHGTEYDRTAWKAFNRCLQIIDKYKAERTDNAEV